MSLSKAKILIVDDEPQLRRVISTSLVSNGYTVEQARTGEEALNKLREQKHDLVLLDLNMPGMGGLETCREIRWSCDVAIIILSVRNTEKDKVQALDAGADDYVSKPFSTPELLARIRAALRRLPVSPDSGSQILLLGDVMVNFLQRRVTAGEREIRLTPKEFDLLQYLANNPDRPVPHRRLLQAVWGPDYGDEVEYLRVFINQLRKKIEPDPSHPAYILTEPWVGYRLHIAK
ncbi:MAG: DNA-binding response regulator [Acidobacteria bacterium]|nr:MAG: DNA-binding response regulator [Acidobacteriota bacterium]